MVDPYVAFREIVEAEDVVPCRDAPELFFSIDKDEPHRGSQQNNHYQAAKKMCAQCPIKMQCLEYALETRQPYGVWGGLTAKERRGLRK